MNEYRCGTCMYNGVLFSHVKGWTLKALCQVRQVRQRQILYDFTDMWNVKKAELIKTKVKWWSLRAGAWGNRRDAI